MLKVTLNILTNPGRRPVASITRPVRELCLANARNHYNGAGFTWVWADGEPTDASDRRPELPRNLARAIVRPLTAVELAAITQETIAMPDLENPTHTPTLNKLAADLTADTDLGEFLAIEALRDAVIREAALRFAASIRGRRAN